MGHSTLQPDGTIFPLLRDIVSEGAEDLTKAFTANPKATQELIYVIENFVYNMTDIMVSGHYFMSIAKNSLKSIKPDTFMQILSILGVVFCLGMGRQLEVNYQCSK